jgi:Undecaprenyl-phosphate glucose phosphotransferase
MIEFDSKEIVRAELQAAAASNVASGVGGIRSQLPSELSAQAKKIAAQAATNPVSPIIFTGVIRFFEWCVIVSTGLSVFSAYLGETLPLDKIYLSVILGVAFLVLSAFQLAGLYDLKAMRSIGYQAIRVMSIWTAVFLFALSTIFFLKLGTEISRFWLGAWYISGLAAISSVRVFSRMVIRSWTEQGRLERRAVLVGGGKAAEELIKALESSPQSDIRICGVFDDRDDDRSPESCAGYPKLGSVDNLVAFARQARIDLMIVTLPITAENRLLQVLKKLWILPVDIRLSAHTNKLRLRPRSYSYIGNVPFLDVFDKPIADWDVVAKWLFDRIIGLLLLTGALPIMAAVAVAIKLDSRGPVFFRQKRLGFNNEEVHVFKFRSMYTDQCDAKAAKLVTKDDPRVTRVGRFIRKTSLDELPQLFNVVFKGNLSLVGPRPHALSAKADGGLYQDVVDSYFARHKVKPGITGWAQVNGWRGETDTLEKIQRRVEHDLYYIENWSLLFDLQILALTPIALLAERENAY